MIVVVGASGHGREVADVVEAAGEQLLGFVDDGPVDPARLAARGAELLGTLADLDGLPATVVIGIGLGSTRRAVAERIRSEVAPALVHPSATIGTDVELGAGTVIAAGARLTTHIRVGRHSYVGPNATVGHDAVLGDFVTVLPGATISGGVHLGAGATVGTGANVRQGTVVGADATIGAGAVVVADVSPHTTVAGVPARPLHR